MGVSLASYVEGNDDDSASRLSISSGENETVSIGSDDIGSYSDSPVDVLVSDFKRLESRSRKRKR